VTVQDFYLKKFYYYINQIINIAEKHNVPVIFNAVGVEGYDHNDINCMTLKKSINKPCVRQITTRDDIGLLKSKYITNNEIYLEKVADPAVWTKDAFNISKKENSEVIGLGMLREGIFRSNGIDIGLEELLRLWSDIIAELETKDIKWQIFTNGWPSDMKFAINLMKYLKREDEIEELVVPEPGNSKELIETIANYKGIIAGRLHANIVAYSLKVPSVGIVWNDKLKFWGKYIGYPERYFLHHDFDGRKIVDELLKAIEVGYNEEAREDFKMTTYKSLYNFMEGFIKERSKNIQ
jgi:polysaccharide pyruvyl transferase WcaK-like protein